MATIAKDWADEVAIAILADSYFSREDELKRIADIVRQSAGREWRPIETLPLDGELRLFWMAGGMYIAPSVKGTPLTHEERLALVKAGHVDEPWGNPKYAPTHWQPLPPPPTEKD